MAPEIADSDAESDFEDIALTAVPDLAAHKQWPTIECTAHEAEPNQPDVNFDDFISQSQNDTQKSPSEHEASKRSTCSTEELLRGRADAQRALGSSQNKPTKETPRIESSNAPSVKRLKRRHTEAVAETATLHEPGSKRQKRHRTYGNTHNHLSSGHSILFGDDESAVFDEQQQNGMAMTEDSRRTSLNGEQQPSPPPPDLDSLAMLPPGANDADLEDDEDVQIRRRRQPSGMGNYINQSSYSAGGISTTRSSMGGYQSINIDLRGATDSVGFETNPFGSTQLSAEDDYESERIKSIFGQQGKQQIGHENSDLRSGGTSFNDQSMMPNGASVGHSMLIYTLPEGLPNDTQLLSSSGAKSSKMPPEQDESAVQRPSSPCLPSLTELSSLANPKEIQGEGTLSKKRGSKPKSEQTRLSSPGAETEGVTELNSEDHAIRLPKEQYKPRPSRSRRGATESVRHDSPPPLEKSKQKAKSQILQRDDQSSPVKYPISELQLSDEVVIGLPKENYQPRPSRSRSKRLVEDEGEPAPESRQETPKMPQSLVEPEEPAETLKSSKKRGRKAKVKRAKTSAAALLKKSEQMLSEGEEDVVWMETKPAKVKLDPLPEVALEKGMKQEELAAEQKEEDFKDTVSQNQPEATAATRPETHRDDQKQEIVTATSKPKTKKMQFSVEIPTPITADESAPAQSEPQKRGRKKKKPIEVTSEEDTATPDGQVEAETATDPTTTSSQSHSRPALVDKDLNLPPPQPSLEHSKPAPTPSPQKLPPKLSPHSPINPPNASAFKNKYRVGLSRRAPIPSLLKVVRKDRPVIAPREKKGKSKKGAVEDATVVEKEKEKAPVDEGDDDETEGNGTKDVNKLLMMEEEYYSS